MLTGQRGESEVARDVEAAVAESQGDVGGKKAVARCPGYKQAGKHQCTTQNLPAWLHVLSPHSVLCVLQFSLCVK